MTQRRSYLSSTQVPFRGTGPQLPSTFFSPLYTNLPFFSFGLIDAFHHRSSTYRYLHQILHSFMSIPPSQSVPALIILAHKSDLLASTTSSSNTPADQLAVNRVRTILERELEKRRQSQAGGMGIESLGGGEGDNAEVSGLECSGVAGSVFGFSDWEGGEVTFLGTSISRTEKEKASSIGGLEGLQQWLMDLY